MPNTRMLLWIALAAILYLNYEAWMHDYPPGTRDTVSQSATGAPGSADDLATRDAIPRAHPDAGRPAARCHHEGADRAHG